MAKIINILGALLIILTFFIDIFSALGLFALIMVLMHPLLIPLLMFVFIVINIGAYYAVYSQKTETGVLLSFLGGSIGGAIAVHRTGEAFPARKAVITVFQIEMWLLAWLFIGFLLWVFGYYKISFSLPG